MPEAAGASHEVNILQLKKAKANGQADVATHGVAAVRSGDTFGGTKIEGISIAGQVSC